MRDLFFKSLDRIKVGAQKILLTAHSLEIDENEGQIFVHSSESKDNNGLEVIYCVAGNADLFP